MRIKFLNNGYGIAYGRVNSIDNLAGTEFVPFLNSKYKYIADPFLYKKDGEIYIFAEIYLYERGRGCIGYSKYSDGEWSEWKVVISEEFHLSYPQIYEKNGEILICPESSQKHNVLIYKAVAFPDKWEKAEEMYGGNAQLVDTTLFTINNNEYAFTYCIGEGEGFDKGELSLIKVIDNHFDLHSKCLVTKNERNARCAGKVLRRDEKNYRIAQDCKGEYGKGIIINEFVIENDNYTEKVKEDIYPQDVIIKGIDNVRGIHTFNIIDDFAVIDYKYQFFSIKVLGWRIINFIRRHL